MASPLLKAMQRLLTLGRPHSSLLVSAFGCMALVAITTGAYAFLMGPALQFLLTGGEAGLTRVFAVLPGLREFAKSQTLYVLPVLVLIVGAIKGVGYLGQFYFVGLFGQKVVIELRRRIFQKLLALSVQQRTTRLSGDLLSRFTSDVAAVEMAATYTVASWLRDSLQIVVLAAVAVSLSWKLALVTFVVVPIAVFPASRLTAALMRRTREGQAALGSIAGQVQEGLGALRTIQAFNAEAAELDRFHRRTAAVETALNRAAWARAGVPGMMEILASCAIGGALAWALTTRAVEPDALVSFLGALLLVYQPAKDLGRVSQFAIGAAAALERIEAVLHLPELEHSGQKALPPLRESIVIEDVAFSWGKRTALDGVTLTIPMGQVTAVVGESGSGKSTLASLLLRFEVPTRGTLRFDGVDVAEGTLASIRAQFALVTQDALLFSASVKDNLLVARPNATPAELEAACRVAAAWDFIGALPQGLDTQLGERGVTLSGGQRQRLCLARAVLANAPVLILDEATSNLDPESEREVQAALEKVLVGRTAIVIAHRLASLQHASQIVVLDQGRVVEQGTHEQLLARDGRYATLWNASLSLAGRGSG
jgi:ATP-binding cassette, subfamily B, bacterial MsbA